MSGLWIRVEANAGDNDKVWAFGEALDIGEVTALGHLVKLWGAIAQHRPDGRIGDVPPRLLARWAGWTGDAAVFAAAFAALFVCDGLLCGWEERQGKLIERRARDAERKREARSEPAPADIPQDVRGLSADSPQRVRGESAPTERNGTGRHEDQGQPPTSAPAAPPVGVEPARPAAPGTVLALVRDDPPPPTGKALVAAAGEVLTPLAEGAGRREGREAERRGMAAFVFAYWAARMRHPNAKLDRRREQRLVARLRENGDDVSELLYVVDGALKDDHLMGRRPDSTQKYDGVQTLFRDREQVERLAGKGGYRGPEVPHPKLAEFEAAYAKAAEGGRGVA